MYGLDLSMDYKGFDFSMLVQGVAKRDVWMGQRSVSPLFGFANSYYACSLMTDHLDYWSPTNTDAYLPKPYVNAQNDKNSQVSTRYLQDFAYLRLKNLQIGYTLPVKLSNKANIERIRLFFNGENLLTFSKVWGPFDPESAFTGGYNLYAIRKTFSFGLNITF